MSLWRMQKQKSGTSSNSSRSSMTLLCVLWLLAVCLAPGSQGQRLREQEAEQPAARIQLNQEDAVCHPQGCYAVFLQKKSFREAGRSCRERGGTLGTMHTEEAASVVHNLLSGVRSQGARTRLRLWIGLHRPPRQCSSTRPLRGFVWVTGDQDGKFTNWLRDDSPGTCAVPRCVAMTVHTSESGRESGDNFGWMDGSCALPLDGYVCQYNYKGMCPPLKDEGGGPAVYSTPFHLISSILTYIPHGSMASLYCPEDSADGPTQVTTECKVWDDATVGWSVEAPLCHSNEAQTSAPVLDRCLGDHGCEHFCESKDSDYYCYCAEGFVIDEDGYGCNPLTELSSDSAGPTEQPDVRDICVEMGCQHDCVETARGIRCTCPPGYQIGPDGRMCSDVDECQQRPCQQVCANIPGTFHCTCHPGYRPDDDGECVDVDECREENSCSGPCQNTMGSYTCPCNAGYQLARGGECVDVDECSGQSPCQHQCLNFMGGYQCYCDEGFELQSDGLTCLPSPDDEEYSSLTPDLSDSTPDPNPSPDFPWSNPLEPLFEVESNFGHGFQTDDPVKYSPSGSKNHFNHVDSLSPNGHQTDPTPTQKQMTENEIGNEADSQAGGRESNAGPGAEPGRGSTMGTMERGVSDSESAQATNGSAEAEDGSAAAKQKHDKSWLLVALLVPLCVFLVVMLALGIVYCTSCAVDKTLSFSNCHRWILPSSPPETRESKTQA